VSKIDNHCAGTTALQKLRWKSWEETPEEESLEILAKSSNVLQGNVRTHLKCREIINNHFIANLLISVAVNKLWKSVIPIKSWWKNFVFTLWTTLLKQNTETIREGDFNDLFKNQNIVLKKTGTQLGLDDKRYDAKHTCQNYVTSCAMTGSNCAIQGFLTCSLDPNLSVVVCGALE